MATGIQISPSSDITVGTTAISNGTEGRVLFQAGGVVQQDGNFTYDNTLKRLGLKAVGTASTDIPFNVQNSAGTGNLIEIAGNNTMTFLSSGGKIIFSQNTIDSGSVISLRRNFTNQEIIRLDGTNNGGITINPLNDGSTKSVAIGSVANGISMWSTGLSLHNFQIKDSFHNLFHVVGNPNSATATFRLGTIASNTNFFNIHGRNAGGTGLTTNPVFTINSSGTVGIGTEASTPQARLDVRAQGALSTDIAFRVRNSADTITTLASNGLGHIETRVNNSFHFKTSVIGSTNTINKGDFGGYENGMVVGHGNTMNANVNMYIFGNNNSNGLNGYGIIVGYTNTGIFGNVFGTGNTNKAGNTFGNSNAGAANVFGNNNSISVSNGHGGTAFVVGNFLQLPNNININDTIYFGVRSSLGEPHISMHHNNLGIGGVIPTLTNYDLNARGVFYAQIGTAPTTLAANTFGMYSADIVAGNAAPHFRTEAGDVVKLYKETTAIGGAGYVDGVDDPIRKDTTMNGYTLEQVVKALQNFGLLA